MGGNRAFALLKMSHVISICSQNRESLNEVLDLKITSNLMHNIIRKSFRLSGILGDLDFYVWESFDDKLS